MEPVQAREVIDEVQPVEARLVQDGLLALRVREPIDRREIRVDLRPCVVREGLAGLEDRFNIGLA